MHGLEVYKQKLLITDPVKTADLVTGEYMLEKSHQIIQTA